MQPYYLIILDIEDDRWEVINKEYAAAPSDNPVIYTQTTTIDPISGARKIAMVNVENGTTGATGRGELIYISD